MPEIRAIRIPRPVITCSPGLEPRNLNNLVLIPTAPLRDSLLPKLFFAELQVRDAERVIAEVAE